MQPVQKGNVEKTFWAIEEYEYWHEDKGSWTSEQPQACLIRGVTNTEGYVPYSAVVHI